MYRRPSIACALAFITLAAAASAQSPVFTSFEPPTYALGQIQNQDGWVYITGDATKQVVQNAVVFAGAQAATAWLESTRWGATTTSAFPTRRCGST